MDIISEHHIELFWSKVIRSDDPEACWGWAGSTDKDGYGQFTFGVAKKTYRRIAHRLSYTLLVGEIPEGVCLLHTCDNPSCSNPQHLVFGTQADNIADRHRKGRDASGDQNGSRTHPERLKRGDEHPNRIHPEKCSHGTQHYEAKLTEDQVREIRRLHAEEGLTAYRLAKNFGINKGAMHHILTGRSWKHVK